MSGDMRVPHGDLAGAIATDSGKIGKTSRDTYRQQGRGYPFERRGDGTSSKITCDRPKHRSAAFMLEPVSNLFEGKEVRKGRDTEADRQREGVRKQQRQSVNN